MTSGGKSDFQILTFTITELETIYEVVEEKYLEEMAYEMAKDIFGQG